MTTLSRGLCALLLLSGAPALAQEGGGSPRRPAPQQKQEGPEIVHGVYAEFDFGVLTYVSGDASKNNQAGVMAGFAVGADLGPYLKIEGRMLNATNDSTGALIQANPPTYDPRYQCPGTTNQQDCAPAPDIEATLLSAGIKLVLPTSDRLSLHAMADVGVMLGNPDPAQAFKFDPVKQITAPQSVASGQTPIFGVGAGMEYYTRLRHFSIGANVQGWGTGAGGAILTIYPSIKYTF